MTGGADRREPRGATAWSARDLALLAELGRLADLTDPVPAPVRAAAEAAGWALLDGLDESDDSDELGTGRVGGQWLRVVADTALVRSRTVRSVLLAGPDATAVELELRGTGAHRVRLAGLLSSARPVPLVRIAVRRHDEVDVPVDEFGGFTADLPRAPVRLVLPDPAGGALCSPWLGP